MPIGVYTILTTQAPDAALVETDPTGCARATDLDRALRGLPEEVEVAVSSSVTEGRFGLDVQIDTGVGPVHTSRVELRREQCGDEAADQVARIVRDRVRAVAHAARQVDVWDAARCLDAVAVSDGLVAAFGLSAASRLEASVEIAEIESTLLVTIHAAYGATEWVDLEEIVVADCPTAARLVVDSIEQGLGQVVIPRSTRLRGAVGPVAGVGLGALEPRAGLAVTASRPSGAVNPYLVGRTMLSEVRLSPRSAVDPESGLTEEVHPHSGWIELQAGAGLRFEELSRRVLPRVQVLAGPALLFGIGYPVERVDLLPAICFGPGVDLPLSDRWTMLGDLAVTPFPFRLGTGQPHVESVTSAPVRAEVALAWRR